MMKHYKPILLTAGVFIAFGVMPAETVKEPYLLQNKISPQPIEIPPPDLSKIEEKSRSNYELMVELSWVLDKNRKDSMNANAENNGALLNNPQ